MSSSQTEVERAERILKAMAEAEADGKAPSHWMVA